ncbi:hypothetical protein N7535_002128 [Penicillium sp. DV-2018c]|nr:hypothetical protein N7461_004626 [Penicillium sp. DV-2018c]KAJ5583508.1 hypothetical protein N7535_002128 [Penicillium sp. DV-2018c]
MDILSIPGQEPAELSASSEMMSHEVIEADFWNKKKGTFILRRNMRLPANPVHFTVSIARNQFIVQNKKQGGSGEL